MAVSVRESIDSHQLECMEVWGGNCSTEDTVSVFGMDAWVLSIPYGGANRGGDIHYVSMCGSGRIARFVVADVAGHGAAVADLAATLRDLMKKNINRVDQTRFARTLNREFAERSREGIFATAVLVTYFAPTDHLIVCNAGHPPPAWRRATDGVWQTVVPTICTDATAPRGLPLGVVEPTEYQQFAVRLHRGDLVFLYSDSLIEAVNPQGLRLGQEGLLSILREVDAGQPDRFNRSVLAAIQAWSVGRPIDDDITMLLLHHTGQNPPLPSPRTVLKVMGKLVGLVKY